jgi:putative colanic acid biosynthesis acetyltransferase WcaF
MISQASPENPVEKAQLKVHQQASAYVSPWSFRTRLSIAVWHFVWLTLFRWTPKPLHDWRSFLLRLFGAQIEGKVFVASSAQIKMPWNLEMADRACIGHEVRVYNLAPIKLKARATVAQECYLCTGTHDFSLPSLPLVVGAIDLGEDCFIGARAFVNPGIEVGAGAIVGACAVVTRNVPAWTISAGNPNRVIRDRDQSRNTPSVHKAVPERSRKVQ